MALGPSHRISTHVRANSQDKPTPKHMHCNGVGVTA
jgi:hypothetical protein